VCPVDCISLENVTGKRTGWDAWSPRQAEEALERYEFRKTRLVREAKGNDARLEAKAKEKLDNLAQLTNGDDTQRKRAVIEAALAKARAQRR
jgi:electron transport complex protein RnfB